MGTLNVPALWRAAIDAWLIHLTATGARPNTRTTRRQHLERAARRLGVDDPWRVTGGQLVEYAGLSGWEPETRRAHRSSLRSFYAWGVWAGHVTHSPALDLPRVKASMPNPRPAPDSVYHPALADADPRERLMLRLAAEHGMRRCEIAVVHSRDVYEDLHGWSLTVHGKGGRLREVPLLDDVARELRRLPAGYAFPGREDGHISARWCGKLVNRLLPGDWTIHKLRHRAGTAWWEAGERDLLTVAKLLGHSSTAITERYVRADRVRMREVLNAAA